MTAPVPRDLIAAIEEVVGPKGLITDAEALAPYLEEQRGRFEGAAPVVVRPADTEQMAEVVRLCAAAGVAMVPQGGNTGLVGGAVAEAGQVLINTGRMNTIRDVDPTNFTITVEAGCVLADIQAAAAERDCLFPLSLGAEGSCQIGGNIAANAGGINVLRYGTTRSLVMGLEAVLPDGRVYDGLSALTKDNTGYALDQLLVGSEGTLGIVTAATLRLFPAHRDVQTALCAVDDPAQALDLLRRSRAASGDSVVAFELMSAFALDVAAEHGQGCANPFDETPPWAVLVEFATASPAAHLREAFEGLLEEAFEVGVVTDAVIAESGEQRASLWRLRETIPEAQKALGGSIKHDVAVPVSQVPTFLTRATEAVSAEMPGIRPCPFGHVGDGNIHFNLTQPEGMDTADFLDHWEEMNRIVHDIVVELGGSISAEHGIGRLKVDELARLKDPVALDAMRAIKHALDPKNLMNPGKILG